MKMKTRILSLCAILAFGTVACQKTDDVLTSFDEAMTLKSTEISLNDIQVESIADESQIEAEFFSNAEVILRGIANGGGKFKNYYMLRGGLRYQMGQCPDVAIDTAEAGYPITITLNYGESTILHNGRELKGEISIVITGPKSTDGTTRTISYTGFSIDSIAIEGTVAEQFSGNNADSRTITVSSDLTFTLPNGTVYDRVGQRVHNWLEGLDTEMEFDDDKIEITGNVTVTSSTGDTYVKTIVDPLIRLGSCRYFVQGVTQITLNSAVISEIDFGDGECDNEATLTVGDEVSTILLKERELKDKRSKEESNGNR
jgi:hypothetical protein